MAACLAIAASGAMRAEAQLDLVSQRRVANAFDGYALERNDTFEAIEALGPETSPYAPIDPEQRLQRARAATDLWLLSRIDPRRSEVADRLGAAMTLPAASIPSALRTELAALDRGARHEEVAALLDAIALAQSIDAGGSASFDRSSGVRRDALVVTAVGRALADGDDSELASMFADPCAERCPAPFDEWAAPSRVTIASLLEASRAIERLDRAWREGDPFARATWPSLGVHRRRLDLHVHAPSARVRNEAIAAASPGGPPARVDLLVAVTAGGAEIVHVPAVRVRDGRVEDADPPSPIDAPVPGARPSGARPGLVQRLRAIELAPDAIVGVSAASGATSRDLDRALASMIEAQRAPRVVVQRAADGSLRSAPIDVIDRSGVGAPGDVVVTLADAEVAPASLGPRMPGRRVVLDPAEAARAEDVLGVAFTAAHDGDLVAIVRD